MSTPAELYVNGLRKKLANYYATWLPGKKIKLGSVGVIKNNIFSELTSLEKLGIKFTESADSDSTPIDFVSEAGVTMYFKAAGEISPSLPTIPEGKIGMGIEFSQAGAFIVKAAESYQPFIEDIIKLEKDIIEKYKREQWRSEWVVVTSLVTMPSVTIIISNSSQSKIEFSVESNIPVSTLDFGNANLNLGIVSKKGDILMFNNAENLTPFLQLAQLKNKYIFFKGELSIKTANTTDMSMAAITPDRLKNDLNLTHSLYLDLARSQDLKN